MASPQSVSPELRSGPTRTWSRESESHAGSAAAVLAERLVEVRGRTEALCASLDPEDCVAQSMPDASPAVWAIDMPAPRVACSRARL